MPLTLKNFNQTTPPIWLCFKANTAGSTVQLTKQGNPTSVTLETSTDGENWSSYTIGNTITLSNVGDKVYFRNTSETDTGFGTSTTDYYKFVMSGSIAGSGDVTTLLNKNGTTTLSNYCLFHLFRDCASLTTPPELPVSTLGQYCCYGMFRLCTSLTTVPSLPATNLEYYCYGYMFAGSTALTSLPKLPATRLKDYCYYSMFRGCSKIKVSDTQTGVYQTEYRIPVTGTGTDASSSMTNMFYQSGGTFTGTPLINRAVYTSNTVV